ncbi:large conductance mechanosensitive channel protein, partial [Fimicolochytrium jonesii]|uniref:large conductance mechanosensitive channel protein n=1 Tax=Fimicolochytrium jonesii TaxID=1396493 RepID=UPI0022FEAF9F
SKRGVRAAGSILQDFRHFILRGGVIDVCIGFIIGGAFTTIMTSFTQDIIGPVVGLALGSNLQNAFVMLRYPDCAGQNGTDCSSLKTPSQVYAAGGVTWNYGNFFQTLFNFLLTAWILFFMVKVYSAASKQFTDHKSKKDLERLCPYCLKKVPLLATRCYQCTSDL